MDRLTDTINGWTFEETVGTTKNLMEAEKNMFKWDVLRHLRDFAETYREQLKEYQQLEEQGRLLKLPCKVGDTVYIIVGKNISVQKIQRVTIDSERKIEFCTKRRGFALFDIGKTVFLTKSEAEAKLKELRGGENV